MKYLFLLLLVASCGVKPSQRKAVKHFQKFERYGGKINTTPKTIIYRDSIVDLLGNFKGIAPIILESNCPEVIFPKSNVEIRNERKEHKQEEKTKRKEISNDAKVEIKKDNNDRKETKFISNCWSFWDKVIFGIVMFCVTHFLRYIWLFVKIFVNLPIKNK